MARPPVPIDIAKGHRTIAEKKARIRREADLLTGSAFQEWPEIRANLIAHKRFAKTKNLFASNGKDDALLEPIINRYCLMLAECDDLTSIMSDAMDDVKQLMNDDSIEFLVKLEMKDRIMSRYFVANKNVVTKRKMLLDIEKENGMTLLSQLRTTTKKPKEEKRDDSGAMFG